MTDTNKMEAFRKATKEKRQKGRPRLTEEEKQKRIRERHLRLNHINGVSEKHNLKLIRTKLYERECFLWEGTTKEMKTKLNDIDDVELSLFTRRLSKFSLDEWITDMERVLGLVS